MEDLMKNFFVAALLALASTAFAQTSKPRIFVTGFSFTSVHGTALFDRLDQDSKSPGRKEYLKSEGLELVRSVKEERDEDGEASNVTLTVKMIGQKANLVVCKDSFYVSKYEPGVVKRGGFGAECVLSDMIAQASQQGILIAQLKGALLVNLLKKKMDLSKTPVDSLSEPVTEDILVGSDILFRLSCDSSRFDEGPVNSCESGSLTIRLAR
jgi:hypothetical protein